MGWSCLSLDLVHAFVWGQLSGFDVLCFNGLHEQKQLHLKIADSLLILDNLVFESEHLLFEISERAFDVLLKLGIDAGPAAEEAGFAFEIAIDL